MIYSSDKIKDRQENENVKTEKKTKRYIFDLILVLIVLTMLFLIRGNIAAVIAPFIYGLVLAWLLNPLINLLQKWKIKRVLAIALVFLVIIGAITAAMIVLVPGIARDISGLADDVPAMLDFVINKYEELQKGELIAVPEALRGWLDFEDELSKLIDYFRNSLGEFSSFLFASTSKLLDIVMTPIITFYYLKDKDRLIAALMGIFSKKQQTAVRDIAGDIGKALGGFIRGQLLVALFVGVLTGAGCAVIGVPHAIIIGIVAGISNIIPYFGPWIGGIMPVILALMDRPISALWVIIWIVIVQQIEASFISPQIMSHSVGLHPLLVMFSVLLFGSVFGIPGMILGVPITSTIKIIWGYVIKYRESYRNKLLFG